MSKIIPLSRINRYSAKHIRRYGREIVASGILIQDEKVLLIRRGKHDFPNPGAWGLPAGGVEPLETPERAAEREFWEETGIRVKADKLIMVENYFYDRLDKRIHIIEFIYKVRLLKKRVEVQLDSDHDQYCFVMLRELNNYRSLVLPRKRAIKMVFAII